MIPAPPTPADRSGLWRDPRLVVAVWLSVLLVVRIGALAFNPTELFVDEAQYWLWSRELAAGYFSKPPLLAFIIRAGTFACGSESEFCIRLPMAVLNTVSAVLVFLLAGRLFDRRIGAWAAIIFATVPALSVSTLVVATDVPLLVFWTAALYAFVRLTEKPGVSWALLLGVCLGAGLMAKYAMLYFLLCTLVYMIAARNRPERPRWRDLGLALLVGAAVAFPNLWWNLDNGFVTFRHTGANIAFEGPRFDPGTLLEFVSAQFAVFGPILMVAFLVGAGRTFAGRGGRSHILLLSFSLPVLVLICIEAGLSRAYANWAATTYVAATVMVADLLVNRFRPIWNYTSLGLHLILALVLSVGATLLATGIVSLPDNANPLRRLEGPRDAAARIATALDHDPYAALLTDGKWLSADMQYYLRERGEPKLAWRDGSVARDHFQLTRPYQDTPLEPALLVTERPAPDDITAAFRTVEPLGGGPVGQTGAKQVWLFRVAGYRAPTQ